MQDLVDRYFEAWNTTDAPKRRELIEQTWTAEGRYADPLLDAVGHEGIDEMVAGVQTSYPGHVFERTSDIDEHHDHGRFGWRLCDPEGGVVVEGIDVATRSNGRLASIVGFFGGAS